VLTVGRVPWSALQMPAADIVADTAAAVRPVSAAARAAARDRLDRMTKPRGALGRVEDLAVALAGIARACPPPLPEPAAVAVFAGDHGVHAQGVTPWPQEVTAQMVANFLAGGAVVNAFARQVGASVTVVDVGVRTPLDAHPDLRRRRVADGTADMTAGPAMSRDQARRAVEVGIAVARELVDEGHRFQRNEAGELGRGDAATHQAPASFPCLVTGDMGIANTTAAAALICAFTGADPAVATGRGTGIDDATLARKTAVVRRAVDRHRPDPADPIGVVAAVGGLEHAALAGFVLGGAAAGVPVLLDGVNAGAAALVAAALAPDAVGYCLAGHVSAEPGHALALAALGITPLLDLGMRLGEGTGALLALPVVAGAARALQDVATFDAAGVVDKTGD
jgi:nicotinate-nucleotide--dimethylbenzimidazole phosphoribosyltransferase